jgi:hypothetical protein
MIVKIANIGLHRNAEKSSRPVKPGVGAACGGAKETGAIYEK